MTFGYMTNKDTPLKSITEGVETKTAHPVVQLTTNLDYPPATPPIIGAYIDPDASFRDRVLDCMACLYSLGEMTSGLRVVVSLDYPLAMELQTAAGLTRYPTVLRSCDGEDTGDVDLPLVCYGFSMRTWRVLLRVVDNPGLTLTELCRVEKSTYSNMYRYLKKLSKANLILKKWEDGGRRLYPTSSGRVFCFHAGVFGDEVFYGDDGNLAKESREVMREFVNRRIDSGEGFRGLLKDVTTNELMGFDEFLSDHRVVFDKLREKYSMIGIPL